jgi:hypothetical protein
MTGRSRRRGPAAVRSSTAVKRRRCQAGARRVALVCALVVALGALVVADTGFDVTVNRGDAYAGARLQYSGSPQLGTIDVSGGAEVEPAGS